MTETSRYRIIRSGDDVASATVHLTDAEATAVHKVIAALGAVEQPAYSGHVELAPYPVPPPDITVRDLLGRGEWAWQCLDCGQPDLSEPPYGPVYDSEADARAAGQAHQCLKEVQQ